MNAYRLRTEFKYFIDNIAYEVANFLNSKSVFSEPKTQISQEFHDFLVEKYSFDDKHFNICPQFVTHACIRKYFNHHAQQGINSLTLFALKFSKPKEKNIKKRVREHRLKRPIYLQIRLKRVDNLHNDSFDSLRNYAQALRSRAVQPETI